jgi:hypothetical protein
VSIFDTDRRAATTPPIEDPHRGLDDHDRDQAVRLRRVEDRLLTLSGEDGTNGKLGTLTKRVDAHDGIWKRIGALLAGAVVAGAGGFYTAGQRNGNAESERNTARAELAATRAELREIRSDVAELRLLLPTLRSPARLPAGDPP